MPPNMSWAFNIVSAYFKVQTITDPHSDDLSNIERMPNSFDPDQTKCKSDLALNCRQKFAIEINIYKSK